MEIYRRPNGALWCICYSVGLFKQYSNSLNGPKWSSGGSKTAMKWYFHNVGCLL